MNDTTSVSQAMIEDMQAMPVVGDIKLELTPGQKLRTVALMMAIRYHTETIVKDGVMYQALMASGRNLEPTTYMKVVQIAMAFEAYLLMGPDSDEEVRDEMLKHLGDMEPEPSPEPDSKQG